MYPRNAASPPRIYVGPVVQISDGAVQTSGVAVTVTPEGGSETAGGGTIAYSAVGGVWYTPTQAETNYGVFMVEASKTGCIPAGVLVVTTISAVVGQAVCADTQKVDVDSVRTSTANAANFALALAAYSAETGLAGSRLDGAISDIPTKTEWGNHTVDVDFKTLKLNGSAAYLGSVAFPEEWPDNWNWSTYGGGDTAGVAALLTMIEEVSPGLYRLTAAAQALGPSGLTSQQVRDAQKLAPSVGAPAAGSVDALFADIKGEGWTNETLKAIKDAMPAVDDEKRVTTSNPAAASSTTHVNIEAREVTIE